jgi:NAD+ kinase
MGNEIKNIAVIINMDKPAARKVFESIEIESKRYGYNIFLQKKEAKLLNRDKIGLSDRKLVKKVDLAIAVGGDGTFINASYLFSQKEIPIVGIHIGGLGFLTEFKANEVSILFKQLSNKNYVIEERVMVEGEVLKDSKTIRKVVALNEIVVHKGEWTRILKFKAYINNQYIGTFSGDGVLISTPTGSTGYSLSINGPIVIPSLNLFIFNVIAPHNLSVRPVIVPSDSVINIKFEPVETELVLSADGIKIMNISSLCTVKVTKAVKKINLIRSKNRNFFDILREKFEWVK